MTAVTGMPNLNVSQGRTLISCAGRAAKTAPRGGIAANAVEDATNVAVDHAPSDPLMGADGVRRSDT
jgi:hypothetical protein